MQTENNIEATDPNNISTINETILMLCIATPLLSGFIGAIIIMFWFFNAISMENLRNVLMLFAAVYIVYALVLISWILWLNVCIPLSKITLKDIWACWWFLIVTGPLKLFNGMVSLARAIYLGLIWLSIQILRAPWLVWSRLCRKKRAVIAPGQEAEWEEVVL